MNSLWAKSDQINTVRVAVLGPLSSGKSTLISHLSGRPLITTQRLLNLSLANKDNLIVEFIEVSSRLSSRVVNGILPSVDGLILTCDTSDQTSFGRVNDILGELNVSQSITVALMKTDLSQGYEYGQNYSGMADARFIKTDIYGKSDLHEWDVILKSLVNRNRDNVSVFLG